MTVSRCSGHVRPVGTYRTLQYTYLITIPLLMIYSIGMTVISYKVGYIVLPGYGCEYSNVAYNGTTILTPPAMISDASPCRPLARAVPRDVLPVHPHLFHRLGVRDVSAVSCLTMTNPLTCSPSITHLEGTP